MSASCGPALVLTAFSALLLGALLQISVARLCSARNKGILALLSCLPAVLAVAALIPALQSGGSIDFKVSVWDGPLTLAFHVDALSVLFALMGAVLGAIVLLYSIAYMEHDRAATRFYSTMLVFIGGFIAMVCTANLFLLYLCWETIGLCSFSLVGFWYTDPEAVAGARKVLLMTHLAGYGLLAAALILYFRTGSALWTSPALARSFTAGVFLLMLLALVAKSVQVPLHTWIPEAMAAPTPVSSLLHAACYVTAGVYLAARMHTFGIWPPLWGATLVSLGSLTMVLGVMYAMVQTDLKRMLAFSTVSQIGYMITGLGIGTSLAITAGLLHCLNHGFFKGGLFLNAGAVQHAAGTRDMDQLGGLAQRMPHTTACWLIGAASMAGIPLMSGFVSKWMLYTAALQAGWPIAALIAWIASLGTVFLCAKATSAVFLGPPTPQTENAREAPLVMRWAMSLMAAGSVVLGIAPQLAVNYLLHPILRTFSPAGDLQVTWLGLFSGAGSFSTAGGLALALVSLVLGAGIYALAYVMHPAAGGAVLAGTPGATFTGGEPLSPEARLTARDFSRIFEQYWQPVFRWSKVDALYAAAWRALQSASQSLAVPVAWMEQRAWAMILVFALPLLLLARWAFPAVPAIAAQTPPLAPMRVPALLILATTVAAGGLLIAAMAQTVWRHLALWIFLPSAAAIAGLLSPSALARTAFLETAALLTIALVFRCTAARGARRAYVAMVALSAALLIAGESADSDRRWAGALLLTSACLKFAAVPFLFWLLRLADEMPSLALGEIIAVVDIAAFGELCVSPFLSVPRDLWIAIAAATSLLAALLMLIQRSLKRLLVLSTVEDFGFLFLGLASARMLGFSGALVAAVTHALAKSLLFVCVSIPEQDGALAPDATGLAGRYPMSSFGFLFGMLAMVGVPPTLGYIGRWRLYEVALQINPCLLAVFIASSALALIAWTLALTRIWWGPDRHVSRVTPNQARSEPLLLRLTIALFVLLLLVPGLWPSSLHLLGGGVL